MKKNLRFFGLIICFVVLGFSISSAQCDSLVQAHTSPGYVWGRIGAYADTTFVAPEEWAPYFKFGYEADSSYSEWFFSEFLLNRNKLYLSDWCINRIVNYDSVTDGPIEEWSAAEMRNRSITRTFPVIGGDTLQFFRRLVFVDRLTSSLSHSRYVNANGLSFSVELVNNANGMRLMLLDSFAIATTTDNKRPCIRSWFPMGARVRHAVPTSLTDTTYVFIRINTWTTGASPKPFIRHDGMQMMLSTFQLTNSDFTAYSDSVEANNNCGGDGSCEVSASGTYEPSGVIVSHTIPTDLTSIEIHDIDGSLVWSSSVPLVTNPTFVAESSGLKIILGMSGGSVVCTRKIIVP